MVVGKLGKYFIYIKIGSEQLVTEVAQFFFWKEQIYERSDKFFLWKIGGTNLFWNSLVTISIFVSSLKLLPSIP